MASIRVGIVGCGNISGIYFKNLKHFKETEVVACADLDLERAASVAKENEFPWSGSVDDLLAKDNVDLVLNLTIPAAHYSVAIAALKAGKSVYNEKPLSVERAEGAELVSLAKQVGKGVGCAPDTFMGAGIQTCKKLIDAGAIGTPIGANAFMMSRGPENWHPAPAFFFKRGGGPLFDMGPYYLTALIALLGPIKSVAGLARASFPERHITRGALEGTKLPVETPTHIVGALEFASGASGQLQTTFDVHASEVPRIEIYGSDGTLSVPDPNTFGGPVRIWTHEKPEWTDVELNPRFAENSRGLGVLDLGLSVIEGRPARASGELAFHVLDAMHSILESSEKRAYVDLQSSPSAPAPLPIEGPDDAI